MGFFISAAFLSFLSIALNIYLAIRLKKQKSKPTQTTDAKDLLFDIMSRGRALVEIKVLDPEGLFITRGGR